MRGSRYPIANVDVPILREDWVLFRACDALVYLAEEGVESLDGWWHCSRFTGAARVVEATDELCDLLRPFVCEVAELTANVHLRQRSGIVHSQVPLLDAEDLAEESILLTDDPALVGLARVGGESSASGTEHSHE